MQVEAIDLIDTHAHLNDEKFSCDLEEVLARAREQGVSRIINMGDTMDSSFRVVQLAERHEGLFAGVGIHPEEACELSEVEIDRLAQWAAHPKVVAIGEIGLDYYWEKDAEKRLLQKRMFVRQLDLARQLHMPVCIHDREAHGDMLDLLKREGKGLRGVLHCYSGSMEMAGELFRMGWLIGVDGPLTFKNAAKLPEILQKAPRDMVLAETDSPYLAPVPMRGKRNEPAYVRYVAEKVAELWGMEVEEAAMQTARNAESLYGKLAGSV